MRTMDSLVKRYIVPKLIDDVFKTSPFFLINLNKYTFLYIDEGYYRIEPRKDQVAICKRYYDLSGLAKWKFVGKGEERERVLAEYTLHMLGSGREQDAYFNEGSF